MLKNISKTGVATVSTLDRIVTIFTVNRTIICYIYDLVFYSGTYKFLLKAVS